MGDRAIGDVCRANCGAPARYIGDGKCLFVSAMCNDLAVGEALVNLLGAPVPPGAVLPSDAEVLAHARAPVSER